MEKVSVHHIKQMLLTHSGAEGRLCSNPGRKLWGGASKESNEGLKAVTPVISGKSPTGGWWGVWKGGQSAKSSGSCWTGKVPP